MTERGEGWATLVGSAYDFSVLWHHVTPAGAVAELERAGYDGAGVEMYGSAGERVAPTGADTGGLPWLYLLARKSAS